MNLLKNLNILNFLLIVFYERTCLGQGSYSRAFTVIVLAKSESFFYQALSVKMTEYSTSPRSCPKSSHNDLKLGPQ